MVVLVVDTNEIISALIKDSFRRKILLSPGYRFYAPDFALEEINKHIDTVVKKSKLDRKQVKLLLDMLLERVSVVEFEAYKDNYPLAEQLIGGIDKNDVPFVALALSIKNDGIRTDDGHFLEQNKIKIWNTKDLVVSVV